MTPFTTTRFDVGAHLNFNLFNNLIWFNLFNASLYKHKCKPLNTLNDNILRWTFVTTSTIKLFHYINNIDFFHSFLCKWLFKAKNSGSLITSPWLGTGSFNSPQEKSGLVQTVSLLDKAEKSTEWWDQSSLFLLLNIRHLAQSPHYGRNTK